MDEFFQRLNQPMRQNNPYFVNPCDTGAMVSHLNFRMKSRNVRQVFSRSKISKLLFEFF